MKKIYSTLMIALISVSAFSQSALRAIPGGHVPINQYHKNVPPSTQSTQSFYTDYDYMDEQYQTNTNGYSYTRYIWDMNMRYDYAAGDTSLRWAVVDFSPLWDSYATTPALIPTTYSSLMIDSIFFLCGHSNYSGQNDTILVKIIQLTSGGYPTYPGTVLHTDTIITNVGLSGATWLSSVVGFTTPNYTIANNTTKFGVRVEYYGAPQDTFGLLCGFGDLGSGQCASIPALTNFAIKSQYAPNSYRHDMRFALPPYNITQLPTSTNQDTYYDCDGSGNYSSGTDSENFLQNWGIWIHGDAITGIDETDGNVGVGQNVPNPFSNETTIPYSLKNNSDVSLTIFDVTGKVVMTQSQTAVGAGMHNFTVTTTDLAPGVYYYTVQAGAGKVTHKMIVTE